MVGSQSRSRKDSPFHSLETIVRDRTHWQSAAVVGSGAVFVGALLTAFVLMGFDLMEETEEPVYETAIIVFIQSLGITVEELSSLGTTYQIVADSSRYGIGVAAHYLIPALVLVVAGYALASMHISRKSSTSGSVAAGTLAAVPFCLVLFGAALVVNSDDYGIDIGEVLILGALYGVVFCAVGAALRARKPVLTGSGFRQGIGLFTVLLSTWYFLDSSFEEYTPRSEVEVVVSEPEPESEPELEEISIRDEPVSVEGVSDLDHLYMIFEFQLGFIDNHSFVDDSLFPAWYIMSILVLTGCVLVYRSDITDPFSGFATGARVAFGYGLMVMFILLGYTLSLTREVAREVEEGWSAAESVELLNMLLGSVPQTVILGGVIFPALFSGFGGAIGATAIRFQQADQSSQNSMLSSVGTNTQQGSRKRRSQSKSTAQQTGSTANKQGYVQTARQQLEDEGWSLQHEKLREGVVALTGTRETDGSSQRLVGLVVTEPATEVTTDHLGYLVKQGKQQNADETVLATTQPLSSDSTTAVDKYNVRVLDTDQGNMTRTASSESASANTGQTGQRTAQQRGESPKAILSDPVGQRFVKFVAAAFVTVGAGYAIGLVLLSIVAGEAGEIFGSVALLFPAISAPLVSMVTGIFVGLRLQSDEQQAALASGVGAFIGFMLLVFILLISGSLISSNGGGESADLGDMLLPLIAFGVGVASTGAIMTVVTKRLGF